MKALGTKLLMTLALISPCGTHSCVSQTPSVSPLGDFMPLSGYLEVTDGLVVREGVSVT